ALSDTLAANLPDWQQSVDRVVDRQASETRTHLFKIRTLNTRLEDFSYLKDTENWEPFGVDWYKSSQPGEFGVHSLLVKVFLRYGWVPLGGMIMLL
ncbi:MAG: hypothetical protein GWO24_14530, partial [Akkermansiaceae bacterium]|nr:hypothetical protein [Akkermansiaceae bacterium]